VTLELAEVTQLAAHCLSADRFRHTLGVVSWSEDLARRHGLDLDRVRYAALGHDLAKEIPLDHQVRLARRWGLLRYPEDEQYPEVLHGPLAAHWLGQNGGVSDREVLAAIANHTLGAPGMSELEMLIYSADLTELNRSFPEVDNLRQALYDNLELGTLFCLNHTVKYLVDQKRTVHPLTILTREDLQRRAKFGTE